jgi:MFS transporter, putative metabolite:H+ symporter
VLLNPPTVAQITARLERLPASREMWRLIILISLGACFEIYDLFQTAYLTPGLISAGILKEGTHGIFGLSDQGLFAAVTFGGMFIGTILFAPVADRFGRRAIFTFSLLWYTAASIAMALQSSTLGVDTCRFVSGIGLGVEIVTIDTYISELAPKHVRGKAFAVSQFIQFLAVPILAFLCWALLPRAPLHISGWRWIVFLGATAAIAVWFIRRRLPESPRWLAQHDRIKQAEYALETIEARIEARLGHKLPESKTATARIERSGNANFREIWSSLYRGRTLMLVVFNFFQTVGFYGFGNWVPTLIAAQGTSITRSLQYSVIIALAYPAGPLLCTVIADRIERKWQIVSAALITAIVGLLFARQTLPLLLILCGVIITLSNNLLSYSYHAYQAELYPTRIRARAVGFVYSWSRLSTAFTSIMIGFFLAGFGTKGVFAFIAASMLICVIVIGAFGPRTSGLTLETISS